MSTSYRCQPALPWQSFLVGAGAAGLEFDETAEDAAETNKVLRDPDSGHYLHASTGDGSDTAFERYGANNARFLIEKIEAHFRVRIISEHDDEFWENIPDLEPGEAFQDDATGSIYFKFPLSDDQEDE